MSSGKKLPVVKPTVEGITCFSIQSQYNVQCQRKSCKNWMNSAKHVNCVLVAAQDGPRTLQDVGNFFNLTRMRICQIEKNIYEKIKTD